MFFDILHLLSERLVLFNRIERFSFFIIYYKFVIIEEYIFLVFVFTEDGTTYTAYVGLGFDSVGNVIALDGGDVPPLAQSFTGEVDKSVTLEFTSSTEIPTADVEDSDVPSTYICQYDCTI